MAEEFITLAEVRQHCYLEEDDLSQDPYLNLLVKASLKHIENYTNRVIYADKKDVPEDVENALVWSEDIKIGALLLIGHLYENRETATDAHVREIPFGFKQFVGPYKFIQV